MSRAPWDADHKVTPEQFSRVLERRFPEFERPDVVALRHGWDYLTFRVDGDWVFKVPKRASVVSRMRQEVSLLTALPAMPAAVPRPAFHGVAADDMPYPFFGYPWLEGIVASSPGVDRRAVIHAATGFLDALHSIVPPFAVEGWPDGTWEQRVGRLHRVRDQVPALRPSLEWLARNEPVGGRKTLLHDDLGPEHLLLHPETRELVAVLDWADASRGDPARDMIGLLLWEPVLTAEVHVERGGDDASLRRARAHALLKGLQTLEDHLRWAPDAVPDWTQTLLALQGTVPGLGD